MKSLAAPSLIGIDIPKRTLHIRINLFLMRSILFLLAFFADAEDASPAAAVDDDNSVLTVLVVITLNKRSQLLV